MAIPDVDAAAAIPLPSADGERLSMDSSSSSEHPQVNGNGHAHKPPSSAATSTTAAEEQEGEPEQEVEQDGLGKAGAERLGKLEEELRRTKEEKEMLASQYRNLLEKLTHMRNTLGNKLKLDAEELDRREQAISSLTEKNATQEATMSALTMEIQDQADRAATLNSELALLRSRNSTIDSLEAEVQTLRGERERERLAREEEAREWERERVGWEREREAWVDRERDWERARREESGWRERWEDEKERAGRLEGVLQDFAAAKESELRQATTDLNAQLVNVTQSLAEFKHRAFQAEAELSTSTTNATRCAQLEKDVKEKNLLIGKLRHEAVIINEHLTEALRRLRKSSSENNVDRRLITNTLLAFLSTPRADGKRFEMLSLLANVLGWNDTEREKAGLQRASAGVGKKGADKGKGKAVDEKDETESFSKMWVEFLLKESSQPLSPPASTASMTSPLSTPTATSFPLSPSFSHPTSPSASQRSLTRMSSFSHVAGLGMGNGSAQHGNTSPSPSLP